MISHHCSLSWTLVPSGVRAALGSSSFALAAAAGVPEEIFRCPPHPWFTPRRVLCEVVAGLSTIATAG